MPDITTSSDIDAFMQAADNAAARTSLGLGTAATSASTDFATAAQGATADTAVQPGDLGGAALLNVGTTAGTVAAGDDARFTDARTPTAHAASHVTGGTDKIRDASASQDGLMTTAYASKLDGIEAGADVTDATNVNAAGAVMESDYDANTILAATSDNTPVALTVGEATMVGRQTGGAIAAIARVSAGEITAGTETALRAFSPKDVADMAVTHGGSGGGSDGMWVPIEFQAVSTPQSSVIFESKFDSTYDEYQVRFDDVVSASDAVTFLMGWRDGTSDVTGGTAYTMVDLQYPTNNSTTTSVSAANMHPLSLNNQWGNDTNEKGYGHVTLWPRTTSRKRVILDVNYDDSSVNVPVHIEGMSYLDTNTVMEGCKFQFSTGNISSGNFALFGRKKS